MWKRLTRPNGPGVRQVAAMILLAQAIGYAQTTIAGRPLTRSYFIQSTVMPLWAYSLILAFVGLGLWVTMERRRDWDARLAAGMGFAMQGMIAWTYAVAGAWGGLYWGMVVVWALGLEAMWIRNGNEG